ncbi:MAG: DUF4403 family protein [Chlorobiales bacterium]|nr:DUF4403 family protein [Chlorobiales bacterium]
MKTKKIVGRITLLLILVAFSGCASSIVAPVPERLPSSAVLQVPTSLLSVPVKINISGLKSLMESRLSAEQEDKGLLWVAGKNLEGYGATVQMGVSRSGPVGLSAENDGKLVWSVPLAINHGIMDYPVTLAYARVSRKLPFEGTMSMRGLTKISLDQKWKIKSTTDVNRTWVERLSKILETPLGSIKVDVSDEAEKQILPKLRDAAKKVDAKMDEMVSMRRVLQTAWTALFKPVKLSDSVERWLVIQPQSISTPRILSSENNLVFTPSIFASIAVKTGVRGDSLALAPLPDNILQSVQPNSSPDEEVNISLPVFLNIEEAKSVLTGRVTGKNYEMSDKTELTVTNIDFFTSGNKVILKIDFKAKRPGLWVLNDMDGQIFMEGTPKYNDGLREITIENFDYDLKTKEYLTRENSWLLDDKFVQSIKEQLRFDLRENIDGAMKAVQNAIVNRELEKGVMLNGSIKQIGSAYLYITNDGFLLQVILQGSASISVTSPDL